MDDGYGIGIVLGIVMGVFVGMGISAMASPSVCHEYVRCTDAGAPADVCRELWDCQP